MTSTLLTKSNYYLENGSNLGKQDIVGLQEILREHNRLYYNEESPVVSDEEYDRLFKILKKLEEKYGVNYEQSSTSKIDVLVSNQFQKAVHIYPMISLDNTYDSEDILDFEKRILNILKKEIELPYVIELKFDGLGVSLTYQDGKLIKALTRGNGIEGEDITINAMQIKSIPAEIPFKTTEEIEIRGEVVMPILAFENLNKQRLEAGEKLFANPRNAASGSLRQLDYNVTKSRNLEFFAYSFPYLEKVNKVKTYSEYTDFIKSLGFQVSPYFFEAKNISEIVDEIKKLGENKPKFAFEIDGLVIKLNDLSLWQTLGTTEHHPRYAIAYKFPATNVRTTVLDIEHSVGRTGIITPIAHLKPVNVSGVIVSKATLHNYDELHKKDVRIGDEVFIVRAGEVIPEVISVILEARNGKEKMLEIPTHCPSCNSVLKKDAGKVAWYCPNKKLCPAQTLGSLILFASKIGANIDGMGDKIIELFIEKGYITDFASIYNLEKFKDEILALEGFESKKTQNLFDAITNSRNMNLANFFVALGIPQVGKKTGKILANYVISKIKNSNLEDILFSLNPEDLQEIKDIGPVGAHSIAYYFEEHRDLVTNLLKEINIILPAKVTSNITSNSQISNKSFCVTGSFSDISRDEIHKIIEENGGETRTSVSKNLDFLIAGENAGSKLQKATDFGVKILNLEEFKNMI
ncbi:NAD-dependent DNA ligase LigA [Candidatus Gracilibacteria bacterium]|nr:NAD-dependent DNA ligase LigA [Candidatus Gracilibacteria bacterium]